ncbi:hypothetical protein pb186bvf_019684 [Paramecium bursaria]
MIIQRTIILIYKKSLYIILKIYWMKMPLQSNQNQKIQGQLVQHLENICQSKNSDFSSCSQAQSYALQRFYILINKYDDNFYPEYDNILIWIVTFTTFCLLILTYLTYQTKLNYLKDACIIEPELPLSDSDLYGSFKFEFWLILIHPNYFCQDYKIYFNVQLNPNKLYYNLNDLLTLVTIFRALIVFRICLRFTQYYGSQVQRICNIYVTDMDERFIMKNLVNNKPFSFVIFASLFGILYFTLAFWVAEFPLVRGNKHSLQLLFECFDDVYVIFCTFGANIFWKHNPQTFIARQVLFINVIYAITIRSLFVSAVMSLVQLDDYEMKASSVLDKLVVKEQIKEVSTEVNTLMARCMRYQINPFSVQRVKRIKILMAKINSFKRQYMSIDGESFSFLWKRKVKESTWKVEEMVEDFEKYKQQQKFIIKLIDDQQSDLKLQYMNCLIYLFQFIDISQHMFLSNHFLQYKLKIKFKSIFE